MKRRWLWLGGATVALSLMGLYLPRTAQATAPCEGIVHERRFLQVLSVEIDGERVDGSNASDLSLVTLESGDLQARVFDPDTGGMRDVRGARR